MLDDLKEFNEKSSKELLKNEDCHLELKENMTKLSNQQPLILSKLEIIRPRLKELIRTRIEELVQFIFPINEIQSSKRLLNRSNVLIITLINIYYKKIYFTALHRIPILKKISKVN